MRADADFVDLGNEQVVKLFPPGYPREAVGEEARRTEQIRELGISAPFIHEVVERDGQLGLRMDKINGPDYLEWMLRRPSSLGKLASRFAYEHHEVHMHRSSDLPSLKVRLADRIASCPSLTVEEKTAASRALRPLPDGDRVLHGDFHPENVIVSPDGPVIINWGEVARGHHLADVAKSALVMELGALPWRTRGRRRDEVEAIWDRFRFTYQLEYMKTANLSERDLEAWKLPLAAAMLWEAIEGEKVPLLALVRSEIAKRE
jgi:tRNA A-37 threonylcarbamoyl transferase component Bud32